MRITLLASIGTEVGITNRAMWICDPTATWGKLFRCGLCDFELLAICNLAHLVYVVPEKSRSNSHKGQRHANQCAPLSTAGDVSFPVHRLGQMASSTGLVRRTVLGSSRRPCYY